MAKIITIQQEQRADGVMPYPFFITGETTTTEEGALEPGDVQRQDFWRGKPQHLVGFQQYAERQRVDLWLREFLEDPRRAIGMTPVMRDASGGLATYTGVVEHVTTDGEDV